ncbi:MAG: HAD family phosphatase [Lentilitoribacter sp.]
MRDTKAVLFDMDGLMLDTETISMQSMKKATQRLGLDVKDQWLFDIIGMNRKGAEAYMSDKLGHALPEGLDAAYIEIYSDHIFTQGIDLKPGLIELLDYLSANNIRRAVATSTRTEMAHKKLKSSEIFDYFEHIIGGDQVTNGKPAPDIYLKAAKHVGIEPKYCLALEDSDNGAKAAYAAQISVIVVPDLKQPKDETKKMATKVVTSLHDVRILLENAN